MDSGVNRRFSFGFVKMSINIPARYSLLGSALRTPHPALAGPGRRVGRVAALPIPLLRSYYQRFS